MKGPSAPGGDSGEGTVGSPGKVHGRFRTAFEHAAIGMCLTDTNGIFLEANPAFCDLLGYSEQELTATDFTVVTHPEDLEISRTCMRRLLTGEASVQRLEKRYLHKDGRIIWADVCASLLRDSSGVPSYFITQIQDITERREAERVARERNQVLDSILAASPVGIGLVLDRTRAWVNDAMAAMVGQTVEEHLRAPIRSLYLDETEYRRVGRVLYEDPGQSRTRQTDTSWVCADGCIIQVHLEARPLNADDATQGFIVTASDVTERMRSERELRSALGRLRSLWEATPGGLMVVGANGTLSQVNAAACEILGMPRSQCVGRALDALGWQLIREDGSPFPPDAVPVTVVLRTGKPVHNVVIGLHTPEPGHCIWLLCNAEPVFESADGVAGAVVTTFLDITDRKRAEAALQASELRFREMADLLPDMVFELDHDGRVTYVNRAVSETLGYTRADLDAGLDVVGAMDEMSLARAAEALAIAKAPGQRLVGVYDIRRRDGSTIPAEVHTMRIVGTDGELLGYRGVMRDITDRRRAEAAQRLATVGELAAGVAHEFNNLLAGLMLRAELTAANRTTDAYEELVTTALEVATRGGDVCRALTTFARPAAPRREPMCVEEAIDEGLALAAQEIDNREVVVSRDYRTHGQRVFAGRGQLGQVFLNLLVNACHAMPQGGYLTIETRYVPRADSAGEIVVTIADTGAGIRPEHMSRIFEPFFTTKGRFGWSDISGSGLGLSVSHGIIHAHGGRIAARSRVGVGTTFEVVLPADSGLTCDQQSGDPGQCMDTAPVIQRGGRVLVAEDARALATLIEDLLALEGHEVDRVEDAGAAVAALQASRYDLVITDMLMPCGGGLQVLAAATSTAEPTPVLVITGLPEGRVDDDALAMGAAGVIHKPVSRVELISAVNGLISG